MPSNIYVLHWDELCYNFKGCRLFWEITATQGDIPHCVKDAHACGKADVALQATRTRHSGSLCEP